MAQTIEIEVFQRQIETLTHDLENNKLERDQILRTIQKRFILILIRRSQEQLDAKLRKIQQKVQNSRANSNE